MILDNIENASRFTDIHPGIAKALHFIKQTNFEDLPFGKYDIEGDDVFVIYKEYRTKPIAGQYLEAHRKYIDVQYIIEGVEQMGVTIYKGQQPKKKYDIVDDYMLFDAPYDLITVNKGMFVIFFPEDLHLPDLQKETSAIVKKAVIKVKIQHS